MTNLSAFPVSGTYVMQGCPPDSSQRVLDDFIVLVQKKIDEYNFPAKIEKDTDRDFWLSGKEAIEYGLIDKILQKKE